MKRLFIMALGLLITFSLNAQNSQERRYQERRYKELKAMTDSSLVDPVYKEILWNTDVLNAIESRLIRLEDSITPRYKLYKTQNMWTFLELDTYFGRIYKLQWSVDSKKTDRFKRLIGDVADIDEPSKNYYPGRFELYETTNIYNFILIDTRTGKTWQIQWGMNRDEDGIWPIEY